MARTTGSERPYLYARLACSVNEPFSVRDLMQRPSLDYFERARRVFQPH